MYYRNENDNDNETLNAEINEERHDKHCKHHDKECTDKYYEEYMTDMYSPMPYSQMNQCPMSKHMPAAECPMLKNASQSMCPMMHDYRQNFYSTDDMLSDDDPPMDFNMRPMYFHEYPDHPYYHRPHMHHPFYHHHHQNYRPWWMY